MKGFTVFIFLCWFLSACSVEQQALPDLPDAQLVRTFKLEQPQRPAVPEFPGRVAAHRRATLAFQVSGPLVELPVQESMQVKKGDLLARIDPRDFQNELDARRADVVEAKAQYERFVAALRQKAVTEAQFEQAEANYGIAKAHLAQAEKQFQDSTLLAPFDGMIASRLVENFQNVQARQAILVLEDVAQLDIFVQVPEQDLTELPGSEELLGQEVASVSFDALPGQSYPVTVKAFETEANPQTQTYLFTLTLPSPKPGLILTGMTATVIPQRVKREEAITSLVYFVPVSAITAGPAGQSYAWVVDNSGETMFARRRAVALGMLSGERIEILDGLKSGDELIVQGAAQLIDGDLVQRIESPES